MKNECVWGCFPPLFFPAVRDMYEGVCAKLSVSSYTRWSKTSALDGHTATHPYASVLSIYKTLSTEQH